MQVQVDSFSGLLTRSTTGGGSRGSGQGLSAMSSKLGASESVKNRGKPNMEILTEVIAGIKNPKGTSRAVKCSTKP